jgi:ribosomal protein S19E (S16A)
MSRQIDRLITELVEADMLLVKKLKKAELVELTEVMMVSNMRELLDDTIVEIYEEQFETHLARY